MRRAVCDDCRSLRFHHRARCRTARTADGSGGSTDLAAPRPEQRSLDLATGTGDIAFASAARGVAVVGLDVTPRMIELAPRKKAPAAGPVSFVVGDMMALPVSGSVLRSGDDRLRFAERSRIWPAH